MLIYGDARVTEAGCCMLFMALAAAKIIAATLDYGKEREVLLAGQKSDRVRRIVKLDDTETVVWACRRLNTAKQPQALHIGLSLPLFFKNIPDCNVFTKSFSLQFQSVVLQ